MNQNWNAAGNPRISEPRIQTHEADQAATPAPDESEFGQFEDLTRKLVQVPKSELDEKRKND